MNHGSLIGSCLAALACVALVGCGGENGGGAATRGGWGGGSGGRPATLVVLQAAEIQRIADIVEAIGTTSANESVTLTAKVTDTIGDVRFDDGDFVTAGDVLVHLTDREEAALLDEAETDLADAERQLARLVGLFEQGSVPESDADDARARRDRAQARYQSIVARLDDRLVRAPFSGVLGFRQVSAGSLVTPGTAITTLDDISIIKLDFSIPEIYLGQVRVGSRLTATSVAFGGVDFPAEVRTVGSRVNPVTRAVPIRAHIDNADGRLRPGMLMTVEVSTEARDAVTVPESSLLQRGPDTFVYTTTEGRATLTQIGLGVRRDGYVEVLGGIDAGREVIVEGVLKLRDGMPVRTGGEGGRERARSE